MEEEARLRVRQIPDVQQELVLGFVDPVPSLLDAAHVGQEQHRHEQGVVPQLLVVQSVRGQVLEPAALGLGELVHEPLGPVATDGPVALVAGVLVEAGEGQQGGGGVHVPAGQALGEARLVIGRQLVQHGGVPRLPVVLPKAVEAHALGPLPVPVFQYLLGRHGRGLHALQELFVVLIEDLLEFADQQLQLLLDDIGPVPHKAPLPWRCRDTVSYHFARQKSNKACKGFGFTL